MKFSILIQGNGEAQTGTENAADIAASKLVNALLGGRHALTHASIILDDTKRLPLVGGAAAHEVPEGIATAGLAELPSELKKLDKKELQALALSLRAELDAARADLEALTVPTTEAPAESTIVQADDDSTPDPTE